MNMEICKENENQQSDIQRSYVNNSLYNKIFQNSQIVKPQNIDDSINEKTYDNISFMDVSKK